MIESITKWDMSVLDRLYGLRNPVLDTFFSLITRLGDAGIFWILLAVVMLFSAKYRKTGITMGVALLMGLIIGNGIVKNVVARIRPYEYYDILHNTKDFINTIVGAQSDFSFPSGHTQASFAAAVAIFMRNKKLGAGALVLAAVISFSRLYLYVHYPTDVIAGMIMGIAWGICSAFIVDYVYRRMSERNVKGKGEEV